MSKYFVIKRGVLNSDYHKCTILIETDDLEEAHSVAVKEDYKKQFSSVYLLKKVEVTPIESEIAPPPPAKHTEDTK